jgi:hypothetical protein
MRKVRVKRQRLLTPWLLSSSLYRMGGGWSLLGPSRRMSRGGGLLARSSGLLVLSLGSGCNTSSLCFNLIVSIAKYRNCV